MKEDTPIQNTQDDQKQWTFPWLEIAAGSAAGLGTGYTLFQKLEKDFLAKAKTISDQLGLEIKTYDDLVDICHEMQEQIKLLEKAPDKGSDSWNAFYTKANDIYDNSIKIIVGDAGKIIVISTTVAVVAGIGLHLAKEAQELKNIPHNNIINQNVALEEKVMTKENVQVRT